MEQTAELYQVVRAQARLETAAFVERYVDLPHAEDGCRGCPNVGQYWTCPPYAFPAAAYWGRFREIELIGQQMHFSEAALAKTYPPEELEELERAVLVRQARLLADEVLPAAPEGSALLTVGGCTLCDSCTRPQGKPCRRPGAISYSLESLGCDVGAAVGALWGWKLLWGERTRLPAYLTLVCAVLLP